MIYDYMMMMIREEFSSVNSYKIALVIVVIFVVVEAAFEKERKRRGRREKQGAIYIEDTQGLVTERLKC